MTTVAKLKEGKLKIVGEFTEKDIPTPPTFTRTSTAYKEDGTSVASGEPRFKCIGKNLVDKSVFPAKIYNNSGYKALVSNGEITLPNRVNGNAGISMSFFKLPVPIPSGTPVVLSFILESGSLTGGTIAISGYHHDDTINTWQPTATNFPIKTLNNDKKIITGTTTDTLTDIWLFVYGDAVITTPIVIKDIQLELGSTATAYEPYQQGVLIEEGTTNLFTSQNFPSTEIYGGTITTREVVTMPQWGTTSATHFVFTPTDGTSKITFIQPANGSTPAVIGTTYSTSCFVKNNGANPIKYTHPNENNSYTTIPVGGIGRYSLTYTATNTNYPKISFLATVAGDVVDITVYQPQAEIKAYPTSFHPTTRSAESLSIPQNALSATEGTIEFDCVFKLDTYAVATMGYKYIADIGSTDANSRFVLYTYPTDLGRIYLQVGYGTAYEQVNTSFVPVKGAKYRFAISFKDKASVWINGVKKGTSVNNHALSITRNPCFGSYFGLSMQADAYFSNLRISSIARSDEELANTGALTVDEYTTYFAPLNSYPLELNQGHFTFTSAGNIPHCEIVERPCIPDDVYYYPLTFDGKDSTHNFSPSAQSNLVFSREGVWVGTATQNYFSAYSPIANNGGSNVEVSNTEGEFGFLASVGAKTWKLIKDGTGNQFNGFEGTYGNWITGVSGDSFTVSGYYKTSDNAGTNLGAFEAYSTDWATQVGDNIYNYGLGTPLEDDKWNYFVSTCTLNQAYTGAIGADLPNWGYSTEAGSLYLHGMMWEKKPFASPFCATTRGAGKLQFNFNSSLGLDWNGDWTICYWKKPVGTHADTLTGYSLDSLGCGSNSIGGGYNYWGKSNNANSLAENFLWDTHSFTSYFNKWHMISLTKSGASLALKFWGVDGNTYTNNFTYGTIASNYYVTQYGYDFMLGGFNNSNPPNSYYKDLVVAKRALTDAELFSIYNTQMKGYNSSGVLLIRDEISEGDLL